jgi:hypothetical protein
VTDNVTIEKSEPVRNPIRLPDKDLLMQMAMYRSDPLLTRGTMTARNASILVTANLKGVGKAKSKNE